MKRFHGNFANKSQETVWKKVKFALTQKIFREINSLVISSVKPLVSRNFCQKSVRVNLRNIQTVLPKALSILDE